MNDIIERTDEIEREASDRLLASNGPLYETLRLIDELDNYRALCRKYGTVAE
jgi:hypothetical protein